MPARGIIFASLGILLAGCMLETQPQPTPATNEQFHDGGLISQIPCGPPCFYGIVPGLATEADIERAEAERSDIYSNCSLVDNTSFGGVRGFRCEGGVGGIYKGQTVDSIGFYPAKNIIVKEIIDLYGPPDFLNVMIVSLPDAPPWSGASLVYGRMHTILGMSDQPGREFRIEPDTHITSVSYLSDARFTEIWDPHDKTSVSWNGFQTYQAILFP